MDIVVCFHHDKAINKQTHAIFFMGIHCMVRVVVEIFKYIIEFMTCIVIKDICEIIIDNFFIIYFLLLLQIGPKNLGNIILKFIVFIVII
jgi:hypothetical protein